MRAMSRFMKSQTDSFCARMRAGSVPVGKAPPNTAVEDVQRLRLGVKRLPRAAATSDPAIGGL